MYSSGGVLSLHAVVPRLGCAKRLPGVAPRRSTNVPRKQRQWLDPALENWLLDIWETKGGRAHDRDEPNLSGCVFRPNELNVRLIKREISEPEYNILWEQIRSRARDGK